MKTFKYNIGGRQLTVRLDDRRGTVDGLLLDGEPVGPAEEEMPAYAAVIALALIEHEVEEVHDEETGVITLRHQKTPWNSPSAMMNRL